MNSSLETGRPSALLSSFWLFVAGCLLGLLVLDTGDPLIRSGAATASGWHSIVHTKTNAFLLWQHGLFSILTPSSAAMAHQACNVLLFAVGMYFLTGIQSSRASIGRPAISLATLAVIALFFGWDQILWGILAWIPALIVLVYQVLSDTSQSWRNRMLSFAAAIFALHAAFQFSFLTILFALSFALLMKKVSQPQFPLLRDRNDFIFLALLFLPWLLYAIIAPVPTFPEYSPLGHVVPDDGLPGNILPLFGPTPPIPVIDHLLVRATAAGLVTGVALVFFLFGRLSSMRLTMAAFALPIFMLLDVVAPEWLSQIAPLATMQRTVPWLFLYPIVFPALAATFVLFVLLLLLKHSSPPAVLIRLCTLSVILWYCTTSDATRLTPGSLYPPESSSLYTELAAFTAEPRFVQYVDQIVVSPSHAVLKKTGIWPLYIRDIIQHWTFSSLLREQPVISTSHTGVEPTSNMHDRNIATRWSPGGGTQRGTEWVYLYLPEPQTIHGIELVTGAFHTDFARGLRISGAPDCKKKIRSPADTELTELFQIRAWDGSLTMTPDGFPYFGGQGGGRIYFPKPTTVNCLLIEQTIRFPGYDWSIAEIRTLRYPQ